MASLEARQLTVTVAGKRVCQDLDLRLEPGQAWAILGRNGVGKTTLLHTLAGLRAPAGGEVLLDGEGLARQPRRQVARRLGLLPQAHQDPFPDTVLATALAGRHPHLQPWQWEGADDLARTRAALAAVDLAGTEQRAITTLSGGERRRLGLAVLLAQDPQVYLLDEPVTYLDLAHQVHLLALLTRQVHEEGRTLCMVLHDVNLALRYCDHLLLLLGEGETAQLETAAATAGVLERVLGYPLVEIRAPEGRFYAPR